MSQTSYIHAGGYWHNADRVWMKRGGVWSTDVVPWIKVSGVWQQCFPTIAHYYSAYISRPVQRNNCGSGYVGSYYTVVASAGMFTSNISQVDANSKAYAYLYSSDAQALANWYGSCSLGGGTFNWHFQINGTDLPDHQMWITKNGTTVVNVTTTQGGSFTINDGDVLMVMATISGNDDYTVGLTESTIVGGTLVVDNMADFRDETDYTYTFDVSYGDVTANVTVDTY